MKILYVLFFGVMLVVYVFCPAYIQFAIMIVNLFIPDPIPVVDEVIMVASFINKVSKTAKVLRWIDNNKAIVGVIGVIIVAVLNFMVQN